jgi:hypothetical protein
MGVLELVTGGYFVGRIFALVVKNRHLQDFIPNLGGNPVQHFVQRRLGIIGNDAYEYFQPSVS